jgi:hypothetical protein
MAESDPPRRVRTRRTSLKFVAPELPPEPALPLHLLRTAMVVRDDIDWPAPTTSEERATLFAAVLGAAQMNGRGLVLARHWLPGLNLVMHAHGGTPRDWARHGVAEWARLEPGFIAWLEEPAGRPGMTTMPTDLAACAMVPAMHPVGLVNLKFTFNCRWPIRSI